MHTTHRSNSHRHVARSRRPSDSQHTSHSRKSLSVLEIAILVVCAVALATVFAVTLTGAGEPDVSSTQVRVEDSQTLWDLALEHPIEGLTTAQTVEHIKSINGLESSGLIAGDLILVPVVSSARTAVASR